RMHTQTAAAPLARNPGTTVNDVHSRLNACRLSALRPATTREAQAILRHCARTETSLAVMGARHAMGGQQFLSDGCVIDASALNRVVAFDPDRGLVTVEAGIRWPALLAWLDAHPSNTRQWTIRQKQTGADDFSLGGALASNIHGRGLAFAPFVDDVEAVELIDADGRVERVDRCTRPDLFALVAGGYGLFGLVTRIVLRLVPRSVLRRNVRLVRASGL